MIKSISHQYCIIAAPSTISTLAVVPTGFELGVPGPLERLRIIPHPLQYSYMIEVLHSVY